MGLNAPIVQYLLERHIAGVDFSQTATIGRQEFHMTPRQVSTLMAKSHLHSSESLVTSSFDHDPPYAEPFFKALGAESLRSFDHSDFEGATDLHNLNDPISQTYHEKFSVVIDGGSLEHIFNFPEAVKNCMSMVRVGGHFLSTSYANNLMGHGFYQFSPELMFRIFSEANGFGDTEVFLVEHSGEVRVWKADDPAKYGGRVQLTNTRPTFMFVSSKKVRHQNPFAVWPAQSDYATRWEDHLVEPASAVGRQTGVGRTPNVSGASASKRFKQWLKTILPESVTDGIYQWRKERQRRNKLKNPFADDCYHKQQW
jgi:hypothetical protein